MRKQMCLLMVAGLIFGAMSLIGCTSDQEQQDEPDAKPQQQTIDEQPDDESAMKEEEPAPAEEEQPAAAEEEPAPAEEEQPAAAEEEPAPAEEEQPAAAEEEPAAAEETPGDKQPTAWADAKVGTMVKYSMPNNMTQKMEVTKVDDEFAYVQMTTMMGDTEVSSTEQKMPRYVEPGAAETPAGVETKDLGTEEVQVAGKTLTCKVTQTTMTVGDRTVTSKTWTCDDVPGGTVKTMSDAMGEMKVMMEVVEFKP